MDFFLNKKITNLGFQHQKGTARPIWTNFENWRSEDLPATGYTCTLHCYIWGGRDVEEEKTFGFVATLRTRQENHYFPCAWFFW